MKKFISKVNTYLLENYPVVWNTRLLWMLSVSLLIHVCFFIVGFVMITNVELLHEEGVIDLFFNNGAVFFGILISILQLVIWLIYMFKNNAFKSFYPTTRFNLFTQFIIYLVIIFSATTFYYSFTAGIKTYVGLTFEDEKMEQEIKTANDAAVFLSHYLGNYTVDNIRYPEPMDSLFCITESEILNEDKPYLTFFDKKYQFYNLKTKEYTIGEDFVDSLYYGYVRLRRTDTTRVYFFKDSVVDISNKIVSSAPSYYNYSGTFFAKQGHNLIHTYYNEDYLDYEYLNYGLAGPKGTKESNQKNYELLKRNDPREIKALLMNFLVVADAYKIKHNIDTESWFELVYHPDTFKISALIHKLEKQEGENVYTNDDFNDLYIGESEKTEYQIFIESISTDSYIESGKLYNVFQNIQEIKAKNVFKGTLQVYIWLTFFLSIFIFTFRVTGLKTILFSIIVAGLLITLVSLISGLYAYVSDYGNKLEFFMSYLVLALGTIIMAIPLFFLNYFKKIITGVLLNISLWGFVPYLLLIFGIITLHQSKACEDLIMIGNTYDLDCFLLIEYLGVTVVSTGLILAGLLFIYLYSGIIKKWKALPEN